jgi:putative Mg2+ transporter-C (MgtC) family protein
MIADLAQAVAAEFRIEMQAFSLQTALIRLLLAATLGAAIGAEREMHAQTAGLRTHILVAMAACLFTLVAYEIMASEVEGAIGLQTDPLRLIEAVTAGVAFLAAGSIITAHGQVKGLTTGAGMWMAGAIGLACGSGRAALAIMATVLALLVLWLLQRVSAWLDLDRE